MAAAVQCIVNGKAQRSSTDPWRTLLDVLREDLPDLPAPGLAAAKGSAALS